MVVALHGQVEEHDGEQGIVDMEGSAMVTTGAGRGTQDSKEVVNCVWVSAGHDGYR